MLMKRWKNGVSGAAPGWLCGASCGAIRWESTGMILCLETDPDGGLLKKTAFEQAVGFSSR